MHDLSQHAARTNPHPRLWLQISVIDAATGLKQNHLYTGQYWDQDAQLVYLRARWYDPRIGRFVSADPFEGQQSDARSLNRYVYAQSDPVHKLDPFGTNTLMELGMVEDILATLESLAANFAKDAAIDLVMDQFGEQLFNTYGSKIAGNRWGGSASGSALVSALAWICFFNHKSCLLRFAPTLVNGVEMPFTTLHIEQAMLGEGNTRFGPGRAAPFVLSHIPGGKGNRTFLEKTGQCPPYPRPGVTCDEYPYASTLQGGEINYMLDGVSVRAAPRREQNIQRDIMKHFYTRAKVPPLILAPNAFFFNAITPSPSFYIDRKGKVGSLQ